MLFCDIVYPIKHQVMQTNNHTSLTRGSVVLLLSARPRVLQDRRHPKISFYCLNVYDILTICAHECQFHKYNRNLADLFQDKSAK